MYFSPQRKHIKKKSNLSSLSNTLLHLNFYKAKSYDSLNYTSSKAQSHLSFFRLVMHRARIQGYEVEVSFHQRKPHFGSQQPRCPQRFSPPGIHTLVYSSSTLN